MEPKKDEKDKIKSGDPSPDDTYEIKRDRVKSFKQIGKEIADRRKKKEVKETSKVDATPDEKVEAKREDTAEPAREETKPEYDEKREQLKKDREEREKQQREEADKRQADLAAKAAREAAEQVAKETRQAFSSEIDKILNKDKDIQEKQNEADALVAAWEKENRLPKDYQEVIKETMRINEARMEQKLKEIDAKRQAEEKERAEQARKTREEAEKSTNERLSSFQKQITEDLEDIYAAKMLPRPAKIEEINNPETTDAAAKETQKLLEFGVKLNTERRSRGMEPVTSLAKIYFLHYKPVMESQGKKDTAQPAGANAPVSGARNQSVAPQTGDKIRYADIHNKSFAQLKAEAMAKIRKAMAR